MKAALWWLYDGFLATVLANNLYLMLRILRLRR